ncbi:anhydro-N-acetylmuramic acid kinase [Tessaracoccus oleiagri]|uniref:Anhydro-N-acetylmuramic acid kinase n=1 Tax=Tessaracoccus oleiagri TaxID=686624 RepID=A0A1G9MG95_9ACTN|nr:anhydro-N-acetylmuramic acid kinase [Tessaracoccus oleiagri]SDL73123.1 anhydro-N-acetylmuramic acid kinase [Tessaracoccus oleiagri]
MRVLGMISGTSLDAIDLAVAEFTTRDEVLELRPVAHGERPWPGQLRADLLAVLPPNRSDVGTWCRLDAEAGQALGEAAAWAIQEFGPVDLIASHGQTLHHWVVDGRARGTLQVGGAAWIHEATRTPVINDLRSADIAAGGQGAPLASTLDALWLGDEPTAALNLGGIANITVVGTGSPVISGDTGPASCLLDAAALELLGQPADRDGATAASGRVDEAALRRLLADPYYGLPLPKSTGREYFHSGYVAERLGTEAPSVPDLFATLTELTAITVAAAINAAGVDRVVASGGGLRNPALLARLRAHLDVPLLTTTELGLDADAKEAYLFALLGFLSATGRPGTIQQATGADRPVVLGSLTPPSPWPTPGSASGSDIRLVQIIQEGSL